MTDQALSLLSMIAADTERSVSVSSMERSVKTDLARSPTILFNVVVRSQSACAAWLVRVQSANAG
jgi:hypothetical protein